MSRVGTDGGKRLREEAGALLEEISRSSLFQSEKAKRYSKPVRMLRKALESDPTLITILRSGLGTVVGRVSRDLDALGVEKTLRKLRKESIASGKDAGDVLVAYIGLKMLEESMKQGRAKGFAKPSAKAQQTAEMKLQRIDEQATKEKVKMTARHMPQITEAWTSRSVRYMDYDWLKQKLDMRLSDEYRKKLLTNTLTPEEALSIYSLFLAAWVDSVQMTSLSEPIRAGMQKLSSEIKNISGIDSAVIAGRKALRLYALSMDNEELLACGLDKEGREFLRFEPSGDSQFLEKDYMWDHIYTMLLISAERGERKIGIPPFALGIAEEKQGGAEIYKINRRQRAIVR